MKNLTTKFLNHFTQIFILLFLFIPAQGQSHIIASNEVLTMINSEDLEKFKDTLEQDSTQIFRTLFGLDCTFLTFIIKYNKPEFTRILLNQIHAATSLNQLPPLPQESLINYINQKDYFGETALHKALSLCSSSDIIESLLKLNASPNLPNHAGHTPLLLAIEARNHESILKLLIQYGAYVNTNNLEGISPLHLAITLEDSDAINLFLIHNANPHSPNQDGKTPIDLLNNERQKKFYKLHQQDSFGETSLHRATRSSNFDLVKNLLNLGADPNIKNNTGNTPLHLSAMDTTFNFRITLVLIKFKADIHAENNQGATPLHLATGAGVLHQNYSVIHLFLSNQAMNYYPDDNMITPFCLTIDPMKAAFYFFNQRNNLEETILHRFVKYCQTDFLEHLLKIGLDPNAMNQDGNTPLHLACQLKDSLEVVKTLLLFHAKPSIKNLNGKTPLELARESSLWDHVQLLTEHHSTGITLK